MSKGGEEVPVTAYVDGLCEPVNPGGVAVAGYAVYRKSTRKPTVLTVG